MKKLIALFIFTFLILPGIISCSGGGTTPTGSASPTTPANTSAAASNPATSANTASAPSSVTSVIQNYYQAIEKHDYVKAYSYVEKDAKTADGQNLTLDLLKQMAISTEDAEGPIQTLSVAAFPAQVVMTITRQKLGPYHTHIQVQQVGSTWKIVSIDRI
ncbi:MAG: hypothetical protein M3Y39_09775 [Chloroflexota bacterium]|nr:hypothetical protein [Chloroflexota bacterium]